VASVTCHPATVLSKLQIREPMSGAEVVVQSLANHGADTVFAYPGGQSMVVQWEDRFFGSNRAHTYLGPIDRPEAIGRGNGDLPETPYPQFVAIARGFGWQARHVEKKPELTAALREILDSPAPYLLDIAVPYQEHVLPMIPSGMTVQELMKE
jgi:thiamine pyrophosphate-dependent acetolactate synthase large subunit-like protein